MEVFVHAVLSTQARLSSQFPTFFVSCVPHVLLKQGATKGRTRARRILTTSLFPLVEHLGRSEAAVSTAAAAALAEVRAPNAAPPLNHDRAAAPTTRAQRVR